MTFYITLYKEKCIEAPIVSNDLSCVLCILNMLVLRIGRPDTYWHIVNPRLGSLAQQLTTMKLICKSFSKVAPG